MNDCITLKSILLLAANPKGTANLRLQEEEREIRERLRLAGYGKVPINSTGATRTRDIQQAMLDFKPQIVHFIGHGAGEDGLALEDATGHLKLIDSEALANLFKLFSGHVECVVLSACHSKFEAEAIAKHIDYAIGMSQEINDRAAIEFAVGFYTALGAGASIELAHKLGCNAIQLEDIPEHLTPTLFVKEKNIPCERSPSNPTKWILVLSGTIDEINRPQAEAIVEHLRQLLGDDSLTLKEIKPGSIKLFLEGSEDGLRRIKSLLREGQLREVLGVPIQNVQRQEDKFKSPGNFNNLQALFDFGRTIIRRYQEVTREAHIIIRCQRQGHSRFRVVLNGIPDQNFYFTSNDLASYLAKQKPQLDQNIVRGQDLSQVLEASILRVLEETGYGQINIQIKRVKSRFSMNVETTLSHRYIVPDESNILGQSFPYIEQNQPHNTALEQTDENI